MVWDRFVYWNADAPSELDIIQALTDYLNGAATIEYKADVTRWFCIFPQAPSHPFRNLGDTRSVQEGLSELRNFEVFIADDNIDVMTRFQDYFIDAIAAGFAELCARQWDGRLEEG